MKRLISVVIVGLAVVGTLAFSAQQSSDFSVGRKGNTSTDECCASLTRDTQTK